jgi:hypothetical protein
MTGSETREFFKMQNASMATFVSRIFPRKLEQWCCNDSKKFYVHLEKVAKSDERSDCFDIGGRFVSLTAFNFFAWFCAL